MRQSTEAGGDAQMSFWRAGGDAWLPAGWNSDSHSRVVLVRAIAPRPRDAGRGEARHVDDGRVEVRLSRVRVRGRTQCAPIIKAVRPVSCHRRVFGLGAQKVNWQFGP